MSVLDCCDVVYMHASSQWLHTLATVYHGALSCNTEPLLISALFICSGWMALSTRKLNHWHSYLLGYSWSPSILSMDLHPSSMGSYCPCCQDVFLLSVLNVCTELGKRTFKRAAPSAWNQLQHYLELVSLDAFKVILIWLQVFSMSMNVFDAL